MKDNALNEYELLNNQCLFLAIDRNAVSDNTLTKFNLNVLS